MWIVGMNTHYENKSWEFAGVYDSKEAAVKRCENDNWWIAKVELNGFVPTENYEFKEYYYYPFN